MTMIDSGGRRILNKVTITGADDSVKPEDIRELSLKYPFVEWGILVSKKAYPEGSPRFPSFQWLKNLADLWEHHKDFNCSAHLCGKWVRQVCEGDWSWMREVEDPSVWLAFNRAQLNFHSYVHKIKDKKEFIKQMRDGGLPKVAQYIFQLDDVNNEILDIAQASSVRAAPLFDLSGGAGVLPEQWPVARTGYCGYAGGLSPNNVANQLDVIEKVCGDGPIWIDVETHVRSEDDQVFDLDKVVAFIENTVDRVQE